MKISHMATIQVGGGKMSKNKKQTSKEQKKQNQSINSGNPKVEGPNIPST